MGWEKDMTDGIKAVVSIPTTILGGILGGGDGNNPLSGILGSIMEMFTGLTMSALLPFLIPIVGLIIIFKLL